MEYATGQQPYDVIVAPAETPISLAELKLYAKVSGTAEDALLTQIIKGVTQSAESYTKRDFVSRTYRTFRDVFGDLNGSPEYLGYPAVVGSSGWNVYGNKAAPFTLRRTPVQSIESIKYYSGGVLTTLLSANYYLVSKPSFSIVAPISGWPTADARMQAVQIEFVAGMGAANTVPEQIKLALLAHATAVYQNRGDCDSGVGRCECAFAPAQSIAVYKQLRIVDFVA